MYGLTLASVAATATTESEKMEPAKLDTATIFKNYRDNKLTNFIVDLVGDKHKNVTWSFRYVNPDNAADVEADLEYWYTYL